MKIIDRYLISQFLKPLAACGAIFTVLVFVGHFFDKMTIFSRYHAHVGDMFAYLVLGIPYWLNVIFPVATLLALMFSLGPLLQRGEITAMRGAGIASFRLYLPFLAMGALISLVSLFGGLSLFPAISSKANVIYRQNIKREQMNNPLRDHIVVAGRNNQRFTIGTLNLKTGTATNIVIDQFDDHLHLVNTLSAQEGQYQDGRWTFRRGTLIQVDADRTFRQETFAEKVVNIHEKPEDLVYENRKPDDMTHGELLQRIRHLNGLGVPSFKEQVALHMQFALPFANVMVILLGIPFALKSLKKGSIQTIAYAFAATFLYWGTVSVFQSYGEQGILRAWVAAWTPNVIFGVSAVWLLVRATKA